MDGVEHGTAGSATTSAADRTAGITDRGADAPDRDAGVTARGAGSEAERPRSARHAEIEARWQEVWDRLGVFRARDDGSAERRYLLTMFPYPSGDLHMGHAEVFALEDVVARFWRQQGYDVMNPVGWDSFGLPAENAAIRRDESPAVFTYDNIETQARSIRRYGVSFDWSRRLHTSDPEYYRWTQWLFVQMVRRGLAYRATSSVNWCPQDHTVLANEQVVDGRCERCGTQVTRRELTQWFLRVTDYADRLLDDMDALEGRWPARVLTMQRNWIGRSRGARIRFSTAPGAGLPEPGSAAGSAAGSDRPPLTSVEVFTTRPDTLPGATFLVVAPDSGLATRLCSAEQRHALEVYRRSTSALSDVDRQTRSRPKTGVPLGVDAVHPETGDRLPVWAADYVLPGFGTGVVMGVPALDERDRAFADAHGLLVREVAYDGSADIEAGEPAGADAPAALVDTVDEAVRRLEAGGYGERATSYRLRDWLVSRQRGWGAPVPIIHCPACGEVPVPDEDLPVRLPDLRGAALLPGGKSPLAAATEWVETTCPRCDGLAHRDTDTMDTFVDSSWYFLRFCSPEFVEGPFDPDAVRRWMPATQYVGGVEHAILHLLYSRFVTKVLHDMGLVDVVEPFASLLNQGQVLNGGKAMSKSLGNGVELGPQLDAYGVDAVRLTMVFAGPPEDDIDWADLSPAGMQRFLARALRAAEDVTSPSGTSPSSGDPVLRRAVHKTVDEVTRLLEATRFNVAVAKVMELVSTVRRAIDTGCGGGDPAVREAAEVVAVLLSLFAPYTAEEMWERLGHEPSVATAGWPAVDERLLVEESVVAVVQVDGRVRDRLTVPADIDEAALREEALSRRAVMQAVGDRPVRRVIVRAPAIVSIVLGD